MLALAAAGRAADSEEDIAGRLFRIHANSPSNDALVCTNAAQAIASLGPGPYRAAARAIDGWHLLRTGRVTDAKAVYQALLEDSSSPPALIELAKRWLTRIDREEVRAALLKVWVKNIRFPDSLDALPAPQPPPVDRWGRAWRYKPGTLKILKSDAQRYELLSPVLGPDSDLADALRRPWPLESSARPLIVNSAPGSNPVVTFQTAGPPQEKAMMTEGKSWMGIVLVKVGIRALIVAESDYVFFPLKPGS